MCILPYLLHILTTLVILIKFALKQNDKIIFDQVMALFQLYNFKTIFLNIIPQNRKIIKLV